MKASILFYIFDIKQIYINFYDFFDLTLNFHFIFILKKAYYHNFDEQYTFSIFFILILVFAFFFNIYGFLTFLPFFFYSFFKFLFLLFFNIYFFFNHLF